MYEHDGNVYDFTQLLVTTSQQGIWNEKKSKWTYEEENKKSTVKKERIKK